jgi:hypothetical protein
MGYRYPGEESKGAIELYPVTAKKSVAAAQEAGLTASSIPTLVVEGDNRAGQGHAISQAIADAGININFLWPRFYAGNIQLSLDSSRKKTPIKLLR